MCQLCRDFDSAVAQGRERPLPLQRLRTLLQNERHKPAARQTKEEDGKGIAYILLVLLSKEKKDKNKSKKKKN